MHKKYAFRAVARGLQGQVNVLWHPTYHDAARGKQRNRMPLRRRPECPKSAREPRFRRFPVPRFSPERFSVPGSNSTFSRKMYICIVYINGIGEQESAIEEQRTSSVWVRAHGGFGYTVCTAEVQRCCLRCCCKTNPLQTLL